jgi:hypothetical protein
VTHADACAYATQGRIPGVSCQQMPYSAGGVYPLAFAFSNYPLLRRAVNDQSELLN